MSIAVSPGSTSTPTLTQLQAAAPKICDTIKRHKGTGKFWVFGSTARNEADVDSDFDLLVEFLPGASYFNLTALEIELTELLGAPVDVMSANAEGYAADHARSQAILIPHDSDS